MCHCFELCSCSFGVREGGARRSGIEECSPALRKVKTVPTCSAPHLLSSNRPETLVLPVCFKIDYQTHLFEAACNLKIPSCLQVTSQSGRPTAKWFLENLTCDQLVVCKSTLNRIPMYQVPSLHFDCASFVCSTSNITQRYYPPQFRQCQKAFTDRFQMS